MKIKTNEREISTNPQIELSISANPDYLSVVRVTVRQAAQIFGLEADIAESVTLGLEEALTNVIRHSYGGPCDKPIIVRLNRIDYGSPKRPVLEIVVRDFGRQVAPDSIKAREPAELRAGGMGVHIMRSLMDEVEFSRADGGGMRLRMVKYITSDVQQQ